MKEEQEEVKLTLGKLMEDFSFGDVEGVYEIGEYHIFEVQPRRGGDKEYHTYRNFKRDGRFYSSLDEALVGMVAVKYEGANSRAGYYFGRMVGILNGMAL